MITLANVGSQLRETGKLISKIDAAVGDVFMCAKWVHDKPKMTSLTHEQLVDQLLNAIDRLRKTV